jgi:predicted amidohydrolase YtcJ
MAEADFVLRGGRVYTVDSTLPWAEAVAISGERITWVGADADANERIGPATQVIDLRGRFLMPGVVDGHNHVRLGGNPNALQLAGLRTLEAVRERIASWGRDHPDAEWIEAEALNYGALETGRLPTAADLEGITGGRPAFIAAFDGHNVVLNREAMQRFGITRATDQVAFGVVEADPASGEPTGVIGHFATMGFERRGQAELARHVPGFSLESQHARLLGSLDMAVACGITTIVEPQNAIDDLPLYSRVRREGHLRSRLIVALFHPPGTTDTELDDFAAAAREHDDDHFRVGPLKLYIDDVIERHTAAMLEPYVTEPRTVGELYYEADAYAELITKLDERGFQTFTHAIGDRGVRVALDAIEAAQARNGRRDRRHQLVHVECIHPDDLGRFAELGVVPMAQPRIWSPEFSGEWVDAVGPERSRYGGAFKSLVDAGAPLAFSSDWNVSEMEPLIGIYTAVTRCDLDGDEPWIPHQRVDLVTAIHAYTMAGAWANHCDHDRGSITAGKYADLVVLSQDLFAIPPKSILETTVDQVFVGGRIVHGDPSS